MAQGTDPPEKDLRVERAAEIDIDALASIAAASFPVPWARATFLDEMRMPWSNLWVVRLCPDGPPEAYGCFWIAGGEAHLLSMAVAPAARRTGVGRALLEAIVAECRRRRADRVVLEVRISNLAAQALYKDFGFVALDVRAKYYTDNGEDALVLVRTLAGEGPG